MHAVLSLNCFKDKTMSKFQNTHHLASNKLIGRIIELGNEYSNVSLKTTDEMVVDSFGLVHGGFVFGLADYAAMLAVNQPTVVLGKADVRFVNPAKVGDELIAVAKVIQGTDYKKVINVVISNDKNKKIFEGDFHCYVLKKHVLA